MQLRIISGEFKGRYVKAPDTHSTRPMTDRVRETLFNILNNYFDFEEKIGLDLFSGSGAIGVEALSRGLSFIHFVEKSQKVIRNLQLNIETLKIQDRSILHGNDIIRFLSSTNEKFDLITADPPFFDYSIYKGVEIIKKKELLSADGIMVIERSIQTRKDDEEAFQMEAFKKVGDALLYFFFNQSGKDKSS